MTLTGESEPRELSEEEFIEAIKKNRHLFPTQRKPNVLVCGQMGVGKTTTINTLFGDDVGRVGHYSRGTTDDELYEWESSGENIDVVDLPGLGDSRKRDRDYAEMYRRRIEDADGFIVVVAPPRAMNRSTTRTVNLLIQCGVDPERIVFAYNRLTDINAPINGQIRRVRINGLDGPETVHDARILEEARLAFFSDLRKEIHSGRYSKRFDDRQIVLYDAFSGWNLFAVFNAVLENLPGDALVKWRNAVEQATLDLQHRAESRIRRQRAEIAKQMASLKEENDRIKQRLTEEEAAARLEIDRLARTEGAAQLERERTAQTERERRETEERRRQERERELTRQLERERAARLETEQRAREADTQRKLQERERETAAQLERERAARVEAEQRARETEERRRQEREREIALQLERERTARLEAEQRAREADRERKLEEREREAAAQLERERIARIETERRIQEAEFERRQAVLEHEQELSRHEEATSRALSQALEQVQTNIDNRILDYIGRTIKGVWKGVKSAGKFLLGL